MITDSIKPNVANVDVNTMLTCDNCGYEVILFNNWDNSQGAEPLYTHNENNQTTRGCGLPEVYEQ